MKCIIIEDEQHNAELLLKVLLKIEPETVIETVLPTIKESVLWLKEGRVIDLIFMDIRLADGLSFEIFREIEIQCPVIFTTAYDEYALQAFKVYGAAYLLKPILEYELQDALEQIKRSRQRISNQEVESIVRIFKSRQKQYKTRFLVNLATGYKSIAVSDIDHIFLNNKVVYIRQADGSNSAVPYTLEELEEELDPNFFFRANRQFIISIYSIEGIYRHSNEKARVQLKQDPSAEIIVSRNKMTFFKTWLDR